MTSSAFFNRVIFNASSGGTGNFVVASAVIGYRNPSGYVPDGSIVSYTAESPDKLQWEDGQGIYIFASNSVQRALVRDNSLGTKELINFSSSPRVRLGGILAQDLRATLLSSTTWYAGPTGDDFTGDGTLGNPWKTVTASLTNIAEQYYLGTPIHTLQLADGTYIGGAAESEFIGGGFIQILGNPSNVDAVVLDGSLNSHYHAAFAFQVPQDTIIALADMNLISDQYVLRVINRCQINFGYINFGGKLKLGSSASNLFKVNCIATSGGTFIRDRTDEIRISGSCNGYIGTVAPLQVVLGENGGTTFMDGTPNFSIGTFFAASACFIDTFPTTFSGSATGKRFAISNGARLTTWNNGTRTYIPGDAEGTLSTGASVIYQ